MSDNVDGLIMEVEEAHNTAPSREQRPVAGLNVGIELQVLGNFFSVEKRFSGPNVQGTLVAALLLRDRFL